MFVLQLNDMRLPKIEILTFVSRSESRQTLIEFIESEKTEIYRDGRWRKCFKKDGPLEWFNAPSNIDESIIDVGIKESWMEEAAKNYEEMVLTIPEQLAGVIHNG